MELRKGFDNKKEPSKARTTYASKSAQKNQIVILSKRTLSNASSLNQGTSRELPSSSRPRKAESTASLNSNHKSSNVTSRKENLETNKRWFSSYKARPPLHELRSKSVQPLHPNNEINRGKLKRPISSTSVASGNSGKRGQNQVSSKNEPGHIEDLSRSSSVTNLNADHKNKGAFSKLRKSASKDRLDKLTEKKNDKKGFVSNNNKLDSPDVDHSLESTQEIETLQKQLFEMAKEKSSLALELGERKGELQSLKNEIVKLKMFQDQSSVRIEQLNGENTSLRNRLRDVSHSPLSDNEKQQLLFETHRHSSAPASIATNLLDDGTLGDITACPTPDWDKHSSSNVSEVSVACLQDKINQMQETHYSTNEELQATLQELTDLQRQLTELQQDNERLSDEKNLMFDSLCRQTERLNDSRSEVESIKQLLYRDKDETGQLESIVDREQKLVDLLKSAQEERESLLLKREQLSSELQDIRSANNEHIIEIEQLTERVRTLESTLDAKHAEHRQIDQELAIAKDQCSARQIEINRLTDLLDNARTKINELEQERALNDKSELDELLDNARKEKDTLESEVTDLKEQIALSRNEGEKLREQVRTLQEECMVTRNNAKCTQSELEYKCEKLAVEKVTLSDQLQQLQEVTNEFQVQTQCHLDDNRQLSAVLSETQRNLSETERKNNEISNEMDELKKIRKEESDEWKKFQNDLLTAVRVANDFKSEAHQELQKMIMENKTHREKIRQLEAQVDKFKGNTNMEKTQNLPYSTSSSNFVFDPSEQSQLLAEQKSMSQPPLDSKLDLNNPPANEQVVITIKDKLSFLPVFSRISGKTKDKTDDKQKAKSEDKQKAKEKSEDKLKAKEKSEDKQKTKEKLEDKLKIIDIAEDKHTKIEKSDDKSKIKEKSEDNAKTKAKSDDKPKTSESSQPSTRYMDFSKLINSKRTKSVPNVSEIKPPLTVDPKSSKPSKRVLSEQEARDLQILNALHSQIDPNALEDNLTNDQKFILKVKTALDTDLNSVALKPVKKQKEQVAISKPLLTSVLNNPRLKEITEDASMVSVEKEDSAEISEVRTKQDFIQNYDIVTRPKKKYQNHFNSNIEFNHYDFEARPKSVTSFKPEVVSNKSKSLSYLYPDEYVEDERNAPPYGTFHDLSSPVLAAQRLSLDSVTRNILGHSYSMPQEEAPQARSSLRLRGPDIEMLTHRRSDTSIVSSYDGEELQKIRPKSDSSLQTNSSEIRIPRVYLSSPYLRSSDGPVLELEFSKESEPRNNEAKNDEKDNSDLCQLEVLLRSKLEEEEFRLVHKIYEEVSRPSSELHDEELELIAFSQRECRSGNTDFNRKLSARHTIGPIEFASYYDQIEENELKIQETPSEERQEIELKIEEPRGDEHIITPPASFEESNEEIAFSSQFEDGEGSHPVEDNGKHGEPIYANYSLFLQQMLHNGDKNPNKEIPTTKKRPFPLPRHAEMTADETVSESSRDISTCLTDISNENEEKILSESSSMLNFNDLNEKHGNQNVRENMPKSPKVFGDVEKYKRLNQTRSVQEADEEERAWREASKRPADVLDISNIVEESSEILSSKSPTEDSSPGEFQDCVNEEEQNPAEVEQHKEGFSLYNIIDRLSHLFDNPSEEATTTFLNSNFEIEKEESELNTVITTENSTITSDDTPTQTAEPIIVGHQYHQQNVTELETEQVLPNYDTLERLATFDILKNTTYSLQGHTHYCNKHGEHTHDKEQLENFKIRSAKEDSLTTDPANIGQAIKKFENLIQANQGQFKSETMRRVAHGSKIPTRIDKYF